MFEKERECECVQYGGEVTVGSSSMAGVVGVLESKAYCVLAIAPREVPFAWPLLILEFPLDSIHLQRVRRARILPAGGWHRWLVMCLSFVYLDGGV